MPWIPEKKFLLRICKLANSQVMNTFRLCKVHCDEQVDLEYLRKSSFQPWETHSAPGLRGYSLGKCLQRCCLCFPLDPPNFHQQQAFWKPVFADIKFCRSPLRTSCADITSALLLATSENIRISSKMRPQLSNSLVMNGKPCSRQLLILLNGP